MPLDFNDRLNNFVSGGAILNAVLLSILVETPSCPLALVTSSAARILHTSSSEQSTSSGQLGEVRWITLSNCMVSLVGHCAIVRQNCGFVVGCLFLFMSLMIFQNFFGSLELSLLSIWQGETQ